MGKLAAILDAKVAKRELMKPDEEQRPREPGKGGHSYEYSFNLNNCSLFKSIGDLKNFKVEMESGRPLLQRAVQVGSLCRGRQSRTPFIVF